MSNLLYNANFSLPPIETNSFSYINNLTTEQKTELGWTTSTPPYSASLQNGFTSFEYTNPSAINLTQFVSLQSLSYISQSFLVANVGNYMLTFKYARRSVSSFNRASVMFDGNVIGTVPTPSSNDWVAYSTIFNISSTGTHTLKIQGVGNLTDGIAITAIVLTPYLSQKSIPITPVTPVTPENQVITHIFDKITKANLKETPQVVQAKKWIGGTKNTDSSGYVKKKMSNAITATKI